MTENNYIKENWCAQFDELFNDFLNSSEVEKVRKELETHIYIRDKKFMKEAFIRGYREGMKV